MQSSGVASSCDRVQIPVGSLMSVLAVAKHKENTHERAASDPGPLSKRPAPIELVLYTVAMCSLPKRSANVSPGTPSLSHPRGLPPIDGRNHLFPPHLQRCSGVHHHRSRGRRDCHHRQPTATVEDVETERDDNAARAEKAEQECDTAVSERTEVTARADHTEDRTTTAEAERDRVVGQVSALIARIPESDREK